MEKIKYDLNLLKIMNLFESITLAKLKDCFVYKDKYIFIVEEGEIGRAIGKKGSNIRRIENTLKKKIRVVEFNRDIIQFIKNLVYPIKVNDVNQEDSIITLTAEDNQNRGLLIGRNASNLRYFESVVKRYFDIKEIKVV